jgi:hypothetical protein
VVQNNWQIFSVQPERLLRTMKISKDFFKDDAAILIFHQWTADYGVQPLSRWQASLIINRRLAKEN